MDYKNGLYTDENGSKYWYVNDRLHKVDGPAKTDRSGLNHWYKNGKRHREDGPALERNGKPLAWFYNDERILCSSNEEFLRIIKLKVFW